MTKLISFLLAILGLADAAYQTYTHFAHTALAGCSSAGDSCVQVQTSSYAWLFGIPVALYGVVFFALMTALTSPWAWRRSWLSSARVVGVITGMIFVIYLIFRELVSIGRICEWCSSVHIIAFMLFALVLTITGRNRAAASLWLESWARCVCPG